MKNEFSKNISLSDSWQTYDANAKWEKEKVGSFGIKFLDDAFDGLAPNDLVLISGGTGGGKTEMASVIAEQAALSGKRVHFFALEAENNEISYRIAYRKFMAEVVKVKHWTERDLRYSQFIRGEPHGMISEHRQVIDEHMNKIGEFLQTRYAPMGFTVEDLAKELDEIKTESDMIIIDHLHYFDLDNENENAAMKSIIKSLRTFVLTEKVPVILVAHIRKQSEISPKLTPTEDDIHGSSDVIKMATKAVMIASGWNKVFEDEEQNQVIVPKATLVRAVKCRRDGTVRFYVGALQFSPQNGGYEDRYLIGIERLKDKKNSFLILEPEKFPKWAKNAKVLPKRIQE